MPIIVGNNPPPTSIQASAIGFIRTKAGNGLTAYTKATEVLGNCPPVGWSGIMVAGYVFVPRSISPLSKLRVTADIKSDNVNLANMGLYRANLIEPTYAPPGSAVLNTQMGIFIYGGGIAGRTITSNVYATKTFDTEEIGSPGVLVIGMSSGGAGGTAVGVKNISITYDIDTTDAYQTPWQGGY